MSKKKLVEIGGTPSPIKHVSLSGVRLFFDIAVIVLMLASFLLFIFTLISSLTFLGLALICAAYTYVLRRFI